MGFVVTVSPGKLPVVVAKFAEEGARPDIRILDPGCGPVDFHLHGRAFVGVSEKQPDED